MAAAACATVAMLSAGSSLAFENGISPFPAGSTGEYVGALPPIPGLFALEQFHYTTSNGLYDNDGNKRPVPFSLSASSATTRLLAAYPVTVLGANLYSQLVIPAVSLRTEVAGHAGKDSGLSNTTVSPAILRWSLTPQASLVAGLDIALATGSYSPTRPSVAVGYTSIQPVLAFRQTDPNGLDIGLSNRLLFNRENGDTHYRSGSGYIAEFTAGWNFGAWKVGVVGAYLNQFRDDEQRGAVINGNRARSFALGPSIEYHAGPISISVNYQRGIYAANTTKNNILGIGVTIPLWVKN
ncbi:SphA family protein [Variovorax robiniae]